MDPVLPALTTLPLSLSVRPCHGRTTDSSNRTAIYCTGRCTCLVTRRSSTCGRRSGRRRTAIACWCGAGEHKSHDLTQCHGSSRSMLKQAELCFSFRSPSLLTHECGAPLLPGASLATQSTDTKGFQSTLKQRPDANKIDKHHSLLRVRACVRAEKRGEGRRTRRSFTATRRRGGRRRGGSGEALRLA